MTGPTRTLHRVVLPVGQKPDVLPLYLTGDVAGAAVDDGRGLTVTAGTTVSFCTFVNGFPAVYWQRWSILDRVELRISASGSGSIVVRGSDETGRAETITTVSMDDPTPAQHRVTVPLNPFARGGWLWFELVAAETAAMRLESAEWCGSTARPAGTVTIGITTFDRPKFCTELLAALSRSGDVLDIVDEVVVVDQGGTPLAGHDGFAEVAKSLGERLRLIRQHNLGGSGGFSRAMSEALLTGRSDYVLLLDDDVALHEPESIRRVLAFADLARTPAIVGGHMLDLMQRCTLNLYAETVRPGRWWPAPADGTPIGHNLAKETLADTPWLHRRADADFTGWWLCLVPLTVIRAVGLTLPAFIKWDDVEYGLRAAAAGFPTVTLPGAAIWHMPWYAKNTATDPLVYFQARNRLIAALAHRAGEPGPALLRESLLLGLKYALTLQYSAAEIILLAVGDVLRGPERLHGEIAADMGRVADLVSSFPDARGKAALAKRHPEIVLPFTGDPWWKADDLDAVLVTSVGGVGGGWGEAESDQFRTLVRRLQAVHEELEASWADLSERYRTALPDLVAPDRWRATFTASGR